MTEIFFPLAPRPHEDPAASGVVQENLEYVMQLFQKGVEDGDILVWDKLLGRYRARGAGGVERVTSIPVTDIYPGKEIILTDNPSSPSYLWHLQYNADSPSAYKWEFIGGTPALSVVATFNESPSTVYTNLGTIGPDVQLPAGVGGDFLISAGGLVWHDISGNIAYMSYAIGATEAIDADAARSGVNNPTSVIMPRRKTAITAGALIRARYRSSTGSFSARFQERWLSVQPLRVG